MGPVTTSQHSGSFSVIINNGKAIMAFAVGKNCTWFVLCSVHTVALKTVVSLHCLKNNGKNPLLKTVGFFTKWGILSPLHFFFELFFGFSFFFFNWLVGFVSLSWQFSVFCRGKRIWKVLWVVMSIKLIFACAQSCVPLHPSGLGLVQWLHPSEPCKQHRNCWKSLLRAHMQVLAAIPCAAVSEFASTSACSWSIPSIIWFAAWNKQ